MALEVTDNGNGKAKEKPKFFNEAGTEAADYKRNNIYRFKPSEIQLPPAELRGRTKPVTGEAFESLKKDIQEHGQDTPCRVTKDTLGRPLLIFGFTRLAAISQLAAEEPDKDWRLEAVYEDNLSPEEMFAKTLSENNQRNPTTPIDDAINIRILQKRFGKSNNDIAKTYQKSITWVIQRAKLTSLSQEHQDMVHSGEMSVESAWKLLDIDPESRDEIVKEAKEDAKEKVTKSGKESKKKNKITTNSVKKAIDKAKDKNTIKAVKNRSQVIPSPDLLRTLKKHKEDKTVGSVVTVIIDFVSGKLTEQKFIAALAAEL